MRIMEEITCRIQADKFDTPWGSTALEGFAHFKRGADVLMTVPIMLTSGSAGSFFCSAPAAAVGRLFEEKFGPEVAQEAVLAFERTVATIREQQGWMTRH
jgi:hypothetical protein